MELIINNCQECPFVEYERGIGFVGCKLSKDITKLYENDGVMPSFRIHELCPIKKNGIFVKIGLD